MSNTLARSVWNESEAVPTSNKQRRR